jgi:DNA-binding response OmpR family regulator
VMILWIEDDFGLDETLGDWLRFEAGLEVLHAKGPKEGIIQLEQNLEKIDLILLDIMMPPEDVVDNVKSDYGKDTGLLLIAELNKITGCKIPIVILSARLGDLGVLAQTSTVRARLEKTLGLEAIVTGIMDVLLETAEGRSS